MKHLLLLFTCLISVNAFAQSWAQTYGVGVENTGHSLQRTSDEGFILLGYTYTAGNASADVLLIKTDEYGMEEWSQTYDDFLNNGMYDNTDDKGYFVEETSDGGFIVAGVTNEEGENSEDGGLDILLLKTGPSGETEWAKVYGYPNNDVAWAVCQTSDGGYAVAGYTVTSPWDKEGHFKEVYLFKTDANGVEEWSQTFGTEEMTAIGYALEQTDDGGFIIGGRIGPGRKIQNNTSSDAYLIKTDASGAELWSQTYGGDYFDTGYSVQQTADGGYILSGFTSESNENLTDRDMYLVKTDGIGTEEWSQTYGDADTREMGYSVQETMDGGYIIGGTRDHWPPSLGDSDMILVKTTEAGSEEWTQTFESEEGSEDSGYDVLQTADECYVLIGTTSNELGSDAYVIKTCEDGTQPVSFLSPHSSERKLEKVVDVMGREVKPVPNQILIYIYTDGSVEQKFIWN